jgi:hypothetical protein
MRTVGTRDRTEIELDAAEALRRGRVLDSILRSAFAPVARGVSRGTHEYFNRLDSERQIQAARRLNTR